MGVPPPFKNHRAWRNVVLLSGNHAEAWALGGGVACVYIFIYLFIYLGCFRSCNIVSHPREHTNTSQLCVSDRAQEELDDVQMLKQRLQKFCGVSRFRQRILNQQSILADDAKLADDAQLLCHSGVTCCIV